MNMRVREDNHLEPKKSVLSENGRSDPRGWMNDSGKIDFDLFIYLFTMTRTVQLCRPLGNYVNWSTSSHASNFHVPA